MEGPASPEPPDRIVEIRECEEDATETQSCGLCGLQVRTCSQEGAWSQWGACSDEGVCAPGDSQTWACGQGQVATRLCDDSCGWGSMGTCGPQDPLPPAFPGAEGFGSTTPGGRGGAVLTVTTLADGDEPGTLRNALMTPGPRIVVFAVGGCVTLESDIDASGEDLSYLTVAGQTAPGGGICVRDGEVRFDDLHDVVLRHLRLRAGDDGPCQSGRKQDGLALNAVSDFIVDHCSVSWGVDENLSITSHPMAEREGDARDITVQWSFVTEGLHDSCNSSGAHSKGLMIAYGATEISVHHNLIAFADDRMPYLPAEGVLPNVVDLTNNVIHDWIRHAAHNYSYVNVPDTEPNDQGSANWVGNRCIPGLDSAIVPCLSLGADTRVYAEGNIGPVRTGSSQDEWAGVEWTSAPSDADFRVFSRLDAPEISTWSAEEATDLVLTLGGATLPARDAVDSRIVSAVQAALAGDVGGMGGVVDTPPEDPDLAAGEAGVDTDGDGMPDDWEVDEGLDAADPGDAHMIRAGSAYTALEDYLNELAGPPP